MIHTSLESAAQQAMQEISAIIPPSAEVSRKKLAELVHSRSFGLGVHAGRGEPVVLPQTAYRERISLGHRAGLSRSGRWSLSVGHLGNALKREELWERAIWEL